MFGQVEGVRWNLGGPFEIDPRSDRLYMLVADSLAQNGAVTEALMTARLNLEVIIDPERGSWVIRDKGIRTITRPMWDCYQAVAEVLLTMDMPTEE